MQQRTIGSMTVKERARPELLKHKTLSASMALGSPGWMDSEEAEAGIAGHWEQLRPLVDWVVRYAAP